MTDDQVVAAAVAAVAAAAAGWQVPALVARLPEPKEPDADKPLYTDLATTRGLGAWSSVAAGLAAGVVGASIGLDSGLPVWIYLCVLGVALSFIDWRCQLLPFWLVAPSYAVVAALLLVAAVATTDWGSLTRAAIGWAATFGVFVLMWLIYPKGLGYGDVRLAGVLGMALGWMGWPQLIVGVYVAFLLGGVVGGILAALKVVDRKGYAFGPFLLVGAWVAVATGPWLSDWWAA